MSIETEIAKALMAKARALAARDRAFFEHFIEPDFLYVSVSGSTVGKADYIEGVCGEGGLRFESQTVSSLRIIARAPLVIAALDLHDVFWLSGQRHDKRFKSLVVLTNRDTQWCWLAGQTMLPSG